MQNISSKTNRRRNQTPFFPIALGMFLIGWPSLLIFGLLSS